MDGAPAITADSYVTCYYGGTIRMQEIEVSEEVPEESAEVESAEASTE